MFTFFSQKNVFGVLFCAALIGLLSGVLSILWYQSQRDFAGAKVKENESAMRVLAKQESESRVQLNKILTPTSLRANIRVPAKFTDVRDEQIIRVKIANRPIIVGKRLGSPREEAIELAMLASRFSQNKE